MKLAQPPIPPKKRAVRARAWRKEGVGGRNSATPKPKSHCFRRLGIKTSKQNNFQFLLRKIWQAGVKKLKENCFALLGRCESRAETRSEANQAFFVQKRFELRSVIATEKIPFKKRNFCAFSHLII